MRIGSEREDRVGEDIIAEMRRLGTFGWSIPKAYGGRELSQEELVLSLIELHPVLRGFAEWSAHRMRASARSA